MCVPLLMMRVSSMFTVILIAVWSSRMSRVGLCEMFDVHRLYMDTDGLLGGIIRSFGSQATED